MFLMAMNIETGGEKATPDVVERVQIVETKSSGKSPLFRKIVAILVLLIIIGGLIVAIKIIPDNDSASITSGFLTQKLEEASDLVTGRVFFTGISDYDDDGSFFLTKGNFTMVWSAKVNAGIDLKKVEIDVDDASKVITIKIPKAKILDCKVDPGKIRYVDESVLSVFNFDDKDDANKAQKMAEKDAEKEAKESGILEMADKQSESLIKGLLEGCTKGYEMKVVKVDD